MRRRGAYVVVGAPGTSLAMVSRLLARKLGGTWAGEDFVFSRSKPAVMFLERLRDTDVERIDAALAKRGRGLTRVIWLQIAEPKQAFNRVQWDRYRDCELPAIWRWVERGVVSRVRAADKSDEVSELAWQALQSPPMVNPAPLYVFVGPPGPEVHEQAARLAARLGARLATPNTVQPYRWSALRLALTANFEPSMPVILAISELTAADVRLLDGALELSGRRITRVVWLLREQHYFDRKTEWDHYRRTTLPAIFLWREMRLVSDVMAELTPDAVESLVWNSLQQEPSYP